MIPNRKGSNIPAATFRRNNLATAQRRKVGRVAGVNSALSSGHFSKPKKLHPGQPPRRDMCANSILPALSFEASATAGDSAPEHEAGSSDSEAYTADIVVKGSADGHSSNQLKRIVLVKKLCQTPWYAPATPVRSNGRSHPLEMR